MYERRQKSRTIKRLRLALSWPFCVSLLCVKQQRGLNSGRETLLPGLRVLQSRLLLEL